MYRNIILTIIAACFVFIAWRVYVFTSTTLKVDSVTRINQPDRAGVYNVGGNSFPLEVTIVK